MMHGYGWVGNGACPFGFGSNYGIWHLVIILVAALGIIAFLTFWKKRRSSNIDAIESLKVLYAKGEISDEDYLKRKSVIERK